MILTCLTRIHYFVFAALIHTLATYMGPTPWVPLYTYIGGSHYTHLHCSHHTFFYGWAYCISHHMHFHGWVPLYIPMDVVTTSPFRRIYASIGLSCHTSLHGLAPLFGSHHTFLRADPRHICPYVGLTIWVPPYAHEALVGGNIWKCCIPRKVVQVYDVFLIENCCFS